MIKELCLVMPVRKQRILMPAPIYYSHKILRLDGEDRKKMEIKGIEPDSKVK